MNTRETSLHEAVRASPLAAGLSQQQIVVLAGLLGRESFQAGEVIAREGTVDDRLVVVVDGTLDIVRHRGTHDETVLATLRAGDLAHELGFLDGTPCYATLVASSPVRVLMLERGRLESLIDSEPRVLYAVMRAILRTTHALQARLSMQALELTNYVVKQHGRY
ncbi:MAG TPA: cyclic nucleotide-binding domain-containing protein [Caldimonas sp.]